MAVLLGAVLLVCWIAWPEDDVRRDLERVTVTFAGFETNGGKKEAVFEVRNGSGRHIKTPLLWTAGGTTYGDGVIRILRTSGPRNKAYRVYYGWSWSKDFFMLPKISGIAPGAMYRERVSPPDKAVLWEVGVGLETIPFRKRYPPFVQWIWKASEKNGAVLFAITPARIDLRTGKVEDQRPAKVEIIANGR